MIRTIGVIGAGAMGAGIAQVALEAGAEVVLHDIDRDAIGRARERIRDGLQRRAATREIESSSVDAWVGARLDALREAHTLDTVASQAELVIEAALEDIELKRVIFRALDAGAPSAAILATNTSALSIATIAAATSHPSRVLGLHFFNPVPRMDLVEVVPGPATSPVVVARAEAEMRRWGKTPVRAADTPGFIVNRVNRPFTIVALRLAKSSSTNLSNAAPVSTAAVQLFLSDASVQLLFLMALSTTLVNSVRWAGVMPGAPYTPRQLPIVTSMPCSLRVGTATPLRRVSDVSAIAFILPDVIYSENSL